MEMKLCSKTTWRSNCINCTIFVILIIFTCLTPEVNCFCPSKCTCDTATASSVASSPASSAVSTATSSSNYRTACINADLEVVPIQLNPDTKYINLTLNKIRNVDFTLPFYTQLEILDLSQNQIETLGSNNFEFQIYLNTLNLSRNSISTLQKNTFKGLTNLLSLDLSFNRIETVDPKAMLDLSNLIQLDFTSNMIVSLDDGLFRNLVSLEILVFLNNQLLDVPTNNLKYLTSLKTLDLSSNLIQNVKNGSFEELKELLVIKMQENVISDFDSNSFDGLSSLSFMDLSDNNLTMVPTQQLSKLANLTYLSLSGNRFTKIPSVAFLNLFHLKDLHLNRLDRLVKIESRAFVDNTNLRKIHLNGNLMFSDLPHRLFHNNPNLLEISMQQNNLQTLDAVQFPVDRLKRLFLGDNPLQCNCSLLWLWRLVTGNVDTNTASSAATAAKSSIKHTSYNDVLYIDSDHITCDITQNSNGDDDGDDDNVEVVTFEGVTKRRGRKLLKNMSESNITCPAHIITIVCAIFTCLLVFMTGASVIFYLRFVKRRRKLLQDRRQVKGLHHVHDRIMQQHTAYPDHFQTLQHHNYPQNTLHLHGHHTHLHQQHHHHHTLDSSSVKDMDKLDLERYLQTQTIQNEYRALKPWEIPPPPLPIKDNIVDENEPEHLYEKFDHYEYPDSNHSLSSKPHVVYV